MLRWLRQPIQRLRVVRLIAFGLSKQFALIPIFSLTRVLRVILVPLSARFHSLPITKPIVPPYFRIIKTVRTLWKTRLRQRIRGRINHVWSE